MITTVKAGTYRVTGDNAWSVQEDLSAAVEIARHKAMEDGQQGILGTRLGPGSFTVALSTKVPYGTIHQFCQKLTGLKQTPAAGFGELMSPRSQTAKSSEDCRKHNSNYD
jgi:hypothetical protein